MAHGFTKKDEKTNAGDKDDNDEVDPVEKMLKDMGCLEKHYAVQECIAETRDWRACQQQVKDFRTCVEEYKKATGKKTS